MSKHFFHFKGYLMIFISAVLFGSYGVWSKIIGNEFGIFFQGWVRSAIVLAILLPVMFYTKSFQKIDRKDLKWFLAPVLFGIFTQAPLYYAYVHADIGTSTLIFYAMFVVTSYLVGWLLLKEKMSIIKIVAMLLSFLGLVLVFGFSVQTFALLALIMAAVNGIASGGEVSTTKKSTEKYSSLIVSAAVWGGIFITHLPASILLGEKQWVPALNIVWLGMVCYAIVGLLAFWLVIDGYRYVDASIGSLIGLFEILAGILYGVIFFSEKVTSTIFIGGIIILLSAMLPDLKEILSRKRKH